MNANGTGSTLVKKAEKELGGGDRERVKERDRDREGERRKRTIAPDGNQIGGCFLGFYP